jgi:hypothetical protein
MGLHAAGDVDRVSPEVIAKFLDADNPSDHRAGVDANAQLKGATVGRAERFWSPPAFRIAMAKIASAWSSRATFR